MTKTLNSKRRCRNGYTYLLVLTVAMIVTVIALSASSVARLNTRGTARANAWTESAALAFSAVEHAVTTLNADPNWRTTYQNDVETSNKTLGQGSFSWKLVDEVDGNLANDATQSVRCYGIGRAGQTVRVYSVSLRPGGPGLEVLKTAAHSSGSFSVSPGVSVTASGGPLSTNATLTNSGTINGNVEALAVTNTGTITGTQTILAPAKSAPLSGVFNMYLAKATDIPWASFGGVGNFQPGLLTAAANPYGPINTEGVYKITVPNSATLTISRSRLRATLVIDTQTNGAVIVSNAVLWEAPQPDYPILLINGKKPVVTLDGSTTPLNEPTVNTNLNPSGSPYNGQSDTDQVDGYPTELRGLIHVDGGNSVVTLGNPLRVKGTILSTGTGSPVAGQITVTGPKVILTADPSLYNYPPQGYMANDKIVPVAGTWRWEPAP